MTARLGVSSLGLHSIHNAPMNDFQASIKRFDASFCLNFRGLLRTAQRSTLFRVCVGLALFIPIFIALKERGIILALVTGN